MADLTPKQEAFLDALFGEAKGDVPKALTAAGYSLNSQYSVLKTLADEIVERSKVIVAGGAAKASMKAVDILDDPTALGSDRLLQVAKEIWDRSGIIKKDALSGANGAVVGVLILPAKDSE